MNKLSFFIALFYFCFAGAITITQSKNGKILLSLDGDKVAVGQNLILKNSAGKKVAIAIVIQVKGEKAIAKIKNGKSAGTETVEIAGAPAAPPPSPEIATSEDLGSKGVYRLNSQKVALLLTVGLNNMMTRQADGSSPANREDVALKGNSFGLAGSFDYPVNSWLIAHTTLGYEPFNATGTALFFSCDSQTSKTCNALINYLSAGGFARINFTNSKAQLWGGLGGALKFPISKVTTALRADDIKMTVTFAGALGVDYFISNKTFIPASFEYQLFQSSDTVTANSILIRVGYGWAF